MTEKPKEGNPEGERAPLCVICRARPQAEKYRPFCSKRCADVDLHRWLDGIYAIPGKPEEEEDGSFGENSEDPERGGFFRKAP